MTSLFFLLAVMALRACCHRRSGYLLDAAILACGAWLFLVQGDAPRMQLAWAWWPAYPLLAAAVFVISVSMTTHSPRAYLRALGASALLQDRHRHWRALRQALLVASHEELVWRIVLQSVLASWLPMGWAVLVVSVNFTFLHRTRIRGNLARIAELFCFSVLLGYLFATWRDPLLIIALHAIRNYLIYLAPYQHEQA